jgi:hypothetical protein
MFLGFLAQKIVTASVSPVIRVSSALYMASFVARANFVAPIHVKGCFALLVKWCMAFVAANEKYVTFPDIEKFSVFYATTQAVLYIFCFRWRELCRDEDLGFGRKGGLEGFEHVILSRFNPLKVISPSVVLEFARITHDLGIMYCYSIIQKNKRLLIPGKPYSGSSPFLDSFFPFDPFKLPISSSFLENLYTSWESHPRLAIEVSEISNDDVCVDLTVSCNKTWVVRSRHYDTRDNYSAHPKNDESPRNAIPPLANLNFTESNQMDCIKESTTLPSGAPPLSISPISRDACVLMSQLGMVRQ